MMCLSASAVAHRLGVRPRDISDLFYHQLLNDGRCPVVAGRRLIPPDYVEVIAMALRRKGIQVKAAGGPTTAGARQ